MNLARMLSAGKTLVGSRQPEGRYHFDARYRLPKFGAVKNPFTKPVETKPEKQPELKITTPAGQSAEDRSAEAKKVQIPPVENPFTGIKNPPLETSKQTNAEPAAVVKEEKIHPVAMFLDWIELMVVRIKVRLAKVKKPKFPKISLAKLNPRKLIPRLKPAVTPIVAKASATTPVQAELSLEKVRVMRNDLSDADLEIVPMQVATAPTPATNPIRRKKETKLGSEPELVPAEA